MTFRLWKRINVRKVGIIGCGAIGTLVAKAVANGTVSCDGLILYDYNLEKATDLQKSIGFPANAVNSVGDMIKLKPTVIVEAASQQAAREYVEKILAGNSEVIIMSVGALLDLKIKNSRIHIPSGAIGGLDAISSAALAGIDEVLLTTKKNPMTLGSKSLSETLIYEGDAGEAVRRFPREMNVAATLALTVGSERVKVRVISDPRVRRNVHEINVKWKHGDMFFRFENDPHPENSGTSALAAWSAIKLLKELLEKSV